MTFIRSLIVTCICLSTTAYAGQFYRWVDSEGNTYIQSSIPPEYVAGGYEVIDDNGVVLKTVAPQISDAERRANEAATVSAEMQRARDEELLKLYRSPSDVDRAMKTWLSRMDMEVRVKQNRIRIKENEFDTLQARAANLEKTGQAIDEELLAKMKAIELEIAQFKLEIRQVELRQDESRAEFMLDRERMVELWQILHDEPWVEPTPSE
ncbi:MAG: hypothetical protein R3227_13290 [Reinekea sp.]|jgi:hypothetical protein|nr:hypothetical protein [Reinekea sp.]